MNDSPILIRYENDPLCGMSRQEFIQLLQEKLAGRIKEAWVFGSFATDTMGKFSDVDLILVKDTKLPFNERAREFDDLYDLGPELDLLIYTPEEFSKMTINPTADFWSRVVSEKIKIL